VQAAVFLNARFGILIATKEKHENMAVKVGINGFGRIGRNVFRSAIGNPDIEFVAVNDLTTPATLAHLLKYDSILGNLKHTRSPPRGGFYHAVDGKQLKVFAERDPAKLDWASVGARDRRRVHRLLHRRREGQARTSAPRSRR
jgi:hypothetical protein